MRAIKIGIMQPYFFPYLGYWQLLNIVDQYVIYDDVNFIKGGWIHKNNILINNESKIINLKLNKASRTKLINEIEIVRNEDEQMRMLKMIERSYKKAPYYELAMAVIRPVILCNELNLAKYLTILTQAIAKYLDMRTNIIISSEMDKDCSLKGEKKIIEICNKLGATQYINAIGGEMLYSKNLFKENNIDLKFIKMKEISYKQFNASFVNHLSIIDIMMFNDKETIKRMLNDFTLV